MPLQKREPPKAKPVLWPSPGIMAGKGPLTQRLRYDGPKPVRERTEAVKAIEKTQAAQGTFDTRKLKAALDNDAVQREAYNRRLKGIIEKRQAGRRRPPQTR